MLLFWSGNRFPMGWYWGSALVYEGKQGLMRLRNWIGPNGRAEINWLLKLLRIPPCKLWCQTLGSCSMKDRHVHQTFDAFFLMPSGILFPSWIYDSWYFAAFDSWRAITRWYIIVIFRIPVFREHFSYWCLPKMLGPSATGWAFCILQMGNVCGHAFGMHSTLLGLTVIRCRIRICKREISKVPAVAVHGGGSSVV